MGAELELLHDRMRMALGEDGFKDLFEVVPDERKEEVVQQQLDRRRVPITISSIKRAPSEAPGNYLIEWHPTDVEANQFWWFPE